MQLSQQGQETQNILNGFFQSVGQKDGESVASFFAEDIDFYIAESKLMPWTGKRTKRSEVSEALHLLFDAHGDGEDQFDTDHMLLMEKKLQFSERQEGRLKEQAKSFLRLFASDSPLKTD